MIKYYQNEPELSSITASHTVLLNRESLREHPMNILLRKKITPGFGLFAGQFYFHWQMASHSQFKCVGNRDRAQLKFILIVL